jgi:murein L,D-transpeptidase YafK
MISTHRFLAYSIPIKVAGLLAFAWYATRPPVTPETAVVDQIVVIKSTHTMTLYAHGKIVRSCKVALGRAEGRKLQQGDHRTPEGHYLVDSHNPHSAFHLSLHVSYPNMDDRARAVAAHAAAGGDVMIHGLAARYAFLGSLQSQTDWTDGCIAVSNAEIEQIYRLVPNNTPIAIEP